MQLSPVPLIRPHTSPSPAPAPAGRAPAPVPRPALGRELQPPRVGAPAPGAPRPAQGTAGRKARGGEAHDGRIWIANQQPLNQVLLARLDCSNGGFPALLVQLPNERKPVRLAISAATASHCVGEAQAESLVALHPVGCSSTRRSWYFRAEPAGNNVRALPRAVPAMPASAEAWPHEAAPVASVAPLRPAGAQASMPFVVLHSGAGAREALYLTRRFDAQFDDAGFSIHLADLPANAQMAGPTPAHLTTVHLNKALQVVGVDGRDTSVMLQGAVSHAQLDAFYDGDMEGPFIELPYAASMALVRLLGSQLTRGKSVAQWHAAVARVAREAVQGRVSEVACA